MICAISVTFRLSCIHFFVKRIKKTTITLEVLGLILNFARIKRKENKVNLKPQEEPRYDKD